MLHVEAWDALIGLTGTIWERVPVILRCSRIGFEFLSELAARVPIGRLVSLSICGADVRSERVFSLGEARPTTSCARQYSVSILRLPAVLGENDHASRALAKKARAKWVFSFRADNPEQPIARAMLSRPFKP